MSLPGIPAPLVELFVADTAEHASALRRSLGQLSDGAPGQQGLVAELLLAVRSLRGAAKIVGFGPIARLAEAVDARLQPLEQSQGTLDRALGTTLLAVVDSLEGLVEAGHEGLGDWARAHGAEVDGLIAGLAQEASAPSPAPAQPPSAHRPEVAPRAVAVSARPAVEANILELFRTEAATCTDVLSRGLVELESGGSADLEALMRAAHSLKGAARIVGIDVAVQLAHALEDCLVNAREGRLALPREAVDLLLASVDLLSEISRSAGPGFEAWVARHGATSSDIVGRLQRLCTSGRPEPVARAAALEPSPAQAPILGAPAAAAIVPAADRVLRVNAQSINRLMGLAGESLVESRRVQTFGSSFQRLKRRQSELSSALEALERTSGAALDALGRAALSDAQTRALECRTLLGEQMAELDGYARRVDDISDRLYREALKSRMRPFGDCAHGFPRMVRDVARKLGKEVRFELHGENTDVDRDVLEGLEAPLTHLLRNAVDHGLELPAQRLASGKSAQGVVRMEARHHAGMLAITVSDDGRGIDADRLRAKIVERQLLGAGVAQSLSSAELFEFIFLPGFSTASSVTEISGRGVGLDAVRSAVESASGLVRVSSEIGRGTSFHLQLPVTRSVMRAVVASIAGEAYAFPLLRIDRILRVPASAVQTLGAMQYFVLEGENISLVSTQQVLGFGSEPPTTAEVCVVVIGDRTRRYGLVVDKFLGEHDLVVRPLDPRLGKVQDIAAAAILVDGAPALILDVDDLVRSVEKLAQAGRLDKLTSRRDAAGKSRKRVLVVDDSITVREVERQLLSNRGYDVDVAVDGMDGLNSLRGAHYDLVVSDIDMPRLSGLELVRAIKQDAKYQTLPVIIVSYKDREEDRLRGLDAGASYYLTKSSFHDETLVRAVEELIGSPES